MVLLRIPYLMLDIPLIQPEVIWLLIGERMANGYSMYVDIIDDNGPLSSGVYWLVHLLAGKSILAYQLLAGTIILFQGIYINSLFIKYKSFEENTYIPALVMVVLFHVYFDFLTLSPVLMGTTFLLLAIGQLFSQTMRHQDSTESILLLGLFGGIATCFHFPLVVFLPFIFVAGVTVTGFSLYQLGLSFVGYCLPISLCALYYFWIDGLDHLQSGFSFATQLQESYLYVSYLGFILLFALPILFTLFGFVHGAILKALTVNQQKQNKLMILFLAFSLLTIVIVNKKAPYLLIVILPGLTYFISQIFIYVKRKKLRTSLFYTFLLGVPLVGYGWTYFQIQSGEMKSYAVNTGEKYEFTRNSKILVLGEDLGYYREASLAGPFLNFDLSKKLLSDKRSLDKLTAVYLAFDEEMPEYVIDEHHIFDSLLIYIPELKTYYSEVNEGVHQLKQP